MKYKGHKFNMWDAWYMNVHGTIHAFHLKAQPGHWNVGHVVTDDLLHFRPYPDVLPPLSEETNPDDCQGKFTGCAYYDDVTDTAYVYYTMRDRRGAEKIGLATSKNMVDFPLYEGNPVLTADPSLLLTESRPTGGADCRDMLVMKDPADGRYYGYFAAMANVEGRGPLGVIAVAVSDDLLTWNDQRIVYVPRFTGVLEVPDVFYLDGKWYLTYLTANIYGARGVVNDPNLVYYTLYASADSPLGPFRDSEDNLFLCGNWDSGYSCRSVEWQDKRYCLYIDRSDYGAAISLPKEVRVINGNLRPCYTPLLQQLRTERRYNHPPATAFEAQSTSFAWHTGDGELHSPNDHTLVASVGAYSYQLFRCTEFTAPSLEAETRVTANCRECGITIATYDAEERPQAVYTFALNPEFGELIVYCGRDGMYSSEYSTHSKRLYPLKKHETYHLRIFAAEGQFEIYVDDVLALQGNMRTDTMLRPALFCAMGNAVFTDLSFYELEQ
ncbi:MAG: hypothetical protein E7549_07055 [Ruminococcaceae bacterium]|nr:hypothetical protein [Oscillospiraceae bacterium]